MTLKPLREIIEEYKQEVIRIQQATIEEVVRTEDISYLSDYATMVEQLGLAAKEGRLTKKLAPITQLLQRPVTTLISRLSMKDRPDAYDFLEAVQRNPDLCVTKVYKKLGYGGSKGQRIKEYLLGEKLITEEAIQTKPSGRPEKYLKLTNGAERLLQERSKQ